MLSQIKVEVFQLLADGVIRYRHQNLLPILRRYHRQRLPRFHRLLLTLESLALGPHLFRGQHKHFLLFL